MQQSRFALLALALVLSWSSVARCSTVIHAGRMIDGRSEEPLLQVTIVVDEGKITSITRGYVDPKPGDTLLKLTEHTVMPGLMDMHTHLQSQHSKDMSDRLTGMGTDSKVCHMSELIKVSAASGACAATRARVSGLAHLARSGCGGNRAVSWATPRTNPYAAKWSRL